MYRIGVIEYLNSIPFVHDLEKIAQIYKDTPRNLALRLMNDEFDAAFIPVVEYLRNKEIYTLIDGVSISSFGPTHSVFIACKTLVNNVRIVQESPVSLSSNFLSRVILKELYGITPLFIDSECTMDTDASIIIGDDALSLDQTEFVHVLDIGEQWYTLTGLPIVYAVCVTKKPEIAPIISVLLEKQRAKNVAHLAAILTSLNKQKYLRYLNTLNYDLTPLHLRSIDTLRGFMI